jgi:hypothetical protein
VRELGGKYKKQLLPTFEEEDENVEQQIETLTRAITMVRIARTARCTLHSAKLLEIEDVAAVSANERTNSKSRPRPLA